MVLLRTLEEIMLEVEGEIRYVATGGKAEVRGRSGGKAGGDRGGAGHVGGYDRGGLLTMHAAMPLPMLPLLVVVLLQVAARHIAKTLKDYASEYGDVMREVSEQAGTTYHLPAHHWVEVNRLCT